MLWSYLKMFKHNSNNFWYVIVFVVCIGTVMQPKWHLLEDILKLGIDGAYPICIFMHMPTGAAMK